MIAVGRALTDHLRRPLVPKLGLWLLVLGWGASVALYWLQDATATSPPPAVAEQRPAIDLETAIAEAAAAPVFGEAAASESAPAAVVAPLDVKLKGVFAGGGGTMAAIVNTGGEEDEFVLLGRELRPGVTLASVHPTHIVVARDGGLHRVELQPVKSEASRSKRAPPPADAVPEPEAPAAPAESDSSPPPAPPMPQSAAPLDLAQAA